MLKSETAWLDNKQPCSRCEIEEDVGFLYPLPDGDEICECCAIDTGWIEAPQGVEPLLPIQPPATTAADYELDEICDLY